MAFRPSQLEHRPLCLGFFADSKRMMVVAGILEESLVCIFNLGLFDCLLTLSIDAPVSCSVGTCLYDDTISWFGCCTGTMRSDCELFTTCVGSASISSCLGNSACANDDYALACTESTAGVCMTMWGEVEEGSVSHFVCGASSTRVQVVATPTAGVDDATETVTATGGTQSRPVTEAGDDDSTSTARTTRTSTSSSVDDRPRVNSAATATNRVTTTAQSTAGAVKTAQAVLGAAGGIVGVLAMFF